MAKFTDYSDPKNFLALKNYVKSLENKSKEKIDDDDEYIAIKAKMRFLNHKIDWVCQSE